MRGQAGVLLAGLAIVTACGSDSPGTSAATIAETATTTTVAATVTGPSSERPIAGGSVGMEEGFIEVADTSVRFQRVDVVDPSVTILFLHGAAFTSDTWVANGILEAVAVDTTSAVAIDLPGYGATSSTDLDDGDFLVSLIDALGLDPAATVIVSPSMSGIFSLGALGSGQLGDLAGFVGVAPSGSGRFADRGEPVDVPALAVWGDGDGADPAAAAAKLASGFVDGRSLVINEAGHAAYQQQPEAFTEALVTFVAGL